MAYDAFGNPIPGTTVPGTGPLPSLLAPGGGESKIDPSLRPYLERGLQRAEQLFFGAQPRMFEGQMYVSPSQQTLSALQQQEAAITAGQQSNLTVENVEYYPLVWLYPDGFNLSTTGNLMTYNFALLVMDRVFESESNVRS